jgi:osmotically-inducible protein OsmY
MKTDAQLQQKVIAKLARELSTSAVAISVGVTEGIVTLAGHVASYADKWDAEQAVEAGHVTLAGEMEWNFQREAAIRVVRTLMGVTGITNRITIAPQEIPITVEIRPVADTRSEHGITKNMVSS